jgi:hypothetical protein
MIKDALKYLEPNAVIPIDMATTIMLVNALKEALAQRTEQEADELTIAYMSGLYDGKKAQRTEPPQKKVWTFWDLSGSDITDAIKAKLKEKNNG